MRIVSWNVNSWVTTVRRIVHDLGLSIEEYLLALEIDILCIQEVKVSESKLKLDNGHSLGTRMNSYDSFWSISTYFFCLCVFLEINSL